MPAAAELLSDILISELSPCASGLSRAVRPPSESVVRVFSTLIPDVEVSHAVLPFGAERLYFNGRYVLFDNSAEMHPPKDAHRREVRVAQQLEASIRVQLLQDVLDLSSKDLPLSAPWWRQLGREDMAQEVENGRITSQQRQRAAARVASAQAALAATVPTYDIAKIVKEVPTTGAARCWYLVRWEGYDCSAIMVHGKCG